MKSWLRISVLCTLCSAVGYASQKPAPFEQDLSYEQMLKYQSGPDHSITPASVLRWMAGRSNDSSKTPSTEFAPTVNVVQTRVRVVAAFNYKF